MVKVLVVEDEASIREMIALNLRLAGMEAVEGEPVGRRGRRTAPKRLCLFWSSARAVTRPSWT